MSDYSTFLEVRECQFEVTERRYGPFRLNLITAFIGGTECREFESEVSVSKGKGKGCRAPPEYRWGARLSV